MILSERITVLPEVVSTEIKNEADYQSALKYYYDCIIGPFKPYMLKALERVEDMDVSMVCTGHGPVLVGSRIKESHETVQRVVCSCEPESEKDGYHPLCECLRLYEIPGREDRGGAWRTAAMWMCGLMTWWRQTLER